MAGQFKGVKARILENNEKALFVHCVNHNLSLVLQEASKTFLLFAIPFKLSMISRSQCVS